MARKHNAKREAARLARYLSTDENESGIVDALSDILIEVSNDSQIFWDKPEIARHLYIEAAKIADEGSDVARRLEQLRAVMDAHEAGRSLAPLMRE